MPKMVNNHNHVTACHVDVILIETHMRFKIGFFLIHGNTVGQPSGVRMIVGISQIFEIAFFGICAERNGTIFNVIICCESNATWGLVPESRLWDSMSRSL